MNDVPRCERHMRLTDEPCTAQAAGAVTANANVIAAGAGAAFTGADQIPEEAIKAAFRAVGEAVAKPNQIRRRQDIVRIALEAAAPAVRAAERQRLLSLAAGLKVTLSRPGNGPAFTEHVAVVPWDKLAEVLEDRP